MNVMCYSGRARCAYGVPIDQSTQFSRGGTVVQQRGTRNKAESMSIYERENSRHHVLRGGLGERSRGRVVGRDASLLIVMVANVQSRRSREGAAPLDELGRRVDPFARPKQVFDGDLRGPAGTRCVGCRDTARPPGT